MTPTARRLPTEAEFAEAMARVRAGRNSERQDLVPREADPVVPDFLILFSLEVEQATKRCIAAFYAWRAEDDQTPIARRRQHV